MLGGAETWDMTVNVHDAHHCTYADGLFAQARMRNQPSRRSAVSDAGGPFRTTLLRTGEISRPRSIYTVLILSYLIFSGRILMGRELQGPLQPALAHRRWLCLDGTDVPDQL